MRASFPVANVVTRDAIRRTLSCVDLRRSSDKELVEHVESLSGSGPDNEALWEALDEVFRRMRAEAPPEKLAYVEAVIRRLTWSFSQRDDDEDGGSPPGTGGVREPRRPAPTAGGAAAEAA
jgi:hypothetical protein